jgi:regulator of cell morphogenesis and NO signaling
VTTAIPAIDTNRTLGDIVAERPGRARVLERAGLDYCCHGRRTLADAATDADLDAAALALELAQVDDPVGADVDALGPVELVDHIVATHHEYLHDELPLLHALASRVRDVHSARHPELHEVARLVAALRADLEPHLAKEEQVLFPAIRRLADGGLPPFGPITSPIRVMEAEHEQAGELLVELRAASGGYQPPEDACASYRQLYERLASLEADTHRHIHLENNVLFPAVRRLTDEPGPSEG